MTFTNHMKAVSGICTIALQLYFCPVLYFHIHMHMVDIRLLMKLQRLLQHIGILLFPKGVRCCAIQLQKRLMKCPL